MRRLLRIARRSSGTHDAVAVDFNRGQRAFFFALGYLGWFLGPLPLALTTTGVVIVMWRRQFASDARKAFEAELERPRRNRDDAKTTQPQATPIKTAIAATIITAEATGRKDGDELFRRRLIN